MRTVTTIATGVAVVTLLVAQAGASILSNDGNGMSGWHGSRYYEELSVSYIAANVEYCVYEPGKFSDSFPGQDPSGGTQYVYAYQVFNNIDPHPSTTHGYASGFSVGLSGHNEQAANIGIIDGADTNPSGQWLSPAGGPYDSAFWEFSGTQKLSYGLVSDILIFTSPFGPEWDNASLSGKWGFGDTEFLPSPAPEPATLVLLALPGAALCRCRRMRKVN